MSYGVDVEKTTLYLPPEMQRDIKLAATRLRRSQADIIREALAGWLRDQRRPRSRSIGMAASGKVQADASEDWIRRRWGRSER